MRALQLIEVGSDVVERRVEVVTPGPLDVVVEVRAAGICHSDVHYRRGPRSVSQVPMTLGHEVAGVVVEVGSMVDRSRIGERACLHYQTSCGGCARCATGFDQFCPAGAMLGRSRPGGWAETITVPSRNAVTLPDVIGFEAGAVMMCSAATSIHALRRAGLSVGERVAVFGVGGLGAAAVQLALAMGATTVFAVDLDPAKLIMAETLGAIPVRAGDAGDIIRDHTAGEGVDIALELVGRAVTMRQAVEVLGVGGRAVTVGISQEPISLVPFEELAMREAQVMGVVDHHLDDIRLLLDMTVAGRYHPVVSRSIGLDPVEVNAVMDELEQGRGQVRTVIVP